MSSFALPPPPPGPLTTPQGRPFDPAPLDDPLPRLIALVTDAQANPLTRTAYANAIRAFWTWYHREPRGPLSKPLLQGYKVHLVATGAAVSTINVALTPLRQLAQIAAELGYIGFDVAAAIAAVPGVPNRGIRLGNWLPPDQIPTLLELPDTTTLTGLRDRAVLATLVACGLRRHEAVCLTVEHLQSRVVQTDAGDEVRWLILNLIGKGGRVRTIPIPADAKTMIDAWCAAAGVTTGPLFRACYKGGRLRAGAIRSDKTIWDIVARYTKLIAPHAFGAHDMRRTFAAGMDRLGADLRAIQQLLGHASPTTTSRYIQTATLDRLASANDRIPLTVAPATPASQER